MNMTDIVVSTLADFFKKNEINFKCSDHEVSVDNPKTEVELIQADVLQCSKKAGKITICGDIENDVNSILHSLHEVVDISQFCDIKFDIWKRKDRLQNGRLDICIPSHGISTDETTIYYSSPIAIKFVDYKRKRYSVDPKTMEELGYRILRFELDNTHEFNGMVYCVGNHINVENGVLCASRNLIGKQMSISVIQDVASKLSIMNLDSCYDQSYHLEQLKPFLKIGEQI